MSISTSTVGHTSADRRLSPSVKPATRRTFKHWSALLGVLLVLGLPQGAWAQTALTWARVELLRNRVQLIPNGSSARAAQVSDIMGIGDSLRTARAARAELRFNDGSLARIGERATFRFTPNTRNFQLSNGTVLLLIPPGRGRTTIQTPNAVTGIQGSALFVRFIEETDTTIIGALTNNPAGPMVAYNGSGSQEQPLYAGQLVVIEGNNITRLFDFDIAEFYRTSGLMEELDAESVEGVYEEMREALEQQQELGGDGLQENPTFIAPPVVSDAPTESSTLEFADVPTFEGSPADRFHQEVATEPRSTRYNQATAESSTPTASIDDTGRANQVTATRQQRNGGNGDSGTTVVTSIPSGPTTVREPAGPSTPPSTDTGSVSTPDTDISNPTTPVIEDGGLVDNINNPETVYPDSDLPTSDVSGPDPVIDTPGSNPASEVPSTPTVTPTVPDTTPTTPDPGVQTPTRPTDGSLDWIPDTQDTLAPTVDTVPTTDSFSDEITDPSLGIVDGPALETNDVSSPEVLSNPLSNSDGDGVVGDSLPETL